MLQQYSPHLYYCLLYVVSISRSITNDIHEDSYLDPVYEGITLWSRTRPYLWAATAESPQFVFGVVMSDW